MGRNLAIKNHFTPPKTWRGNRTINLTQPEIQALKSQMAYTRMGKQNKIKVHLRKFGKTRTDECTFVFVPKLTVRNGIGGDFWALSARVNPNFIAAQMGHVSAQMIYNVYGKWMTGNNDNQMTILNANFGCDAPIMPQAKNQ